LVDPSARDRITIIFHNNSLFGIVHSRKIDVDSFKKIDLVRGHKFLLINKNTSNDHIKEIKKEIIKTYKNSD